MSFARRARVLATLGPASATRDRIRALADAGADVFRLNFSHGGHADIVERYLAIAGMPCGHIGGTNLLRVVKIPENH
ncbi:MAG: hypothetical protein JNK92_03395 [Dechloromonas sp.]|nr:hypothetical protein [Dechloromonas sp.]